MSDEPVTDGGRAIESILETLRNAPGPLTSREISESNARKGVRCPDSTVRFLTSLRARGIIKGEVSHEKGGWVWWVGGE
jgi:hypothetical protein